MRLFSLTQVLDQFLPFPHLRFLAFCPHPHLLLCTFGKGDVTRSWLLPCSELQFSEPRVGLQELGDAPEMASHSDAKHAILEDYLK